MPSFSERLKELRDDKDLDQSVICSAIGIRQNTYSNYERGITEPKFETLIALARFYQTSTDYLLGITDQKQLYPKSKV